MIPIEYEVIKQNMLSMLKYSKLEYRQYKSTKKVIFLQQAGEKLFNALENYIQFVNKSRVESFYELRNSIKEPQLKRLLYDARELHRFFYNGELEYEVKEAEKRYLSVLNRVEGRVKRI